MNKNIYRYYQNSSRLKHLYKETAWGLPFRGAIRCKQYIYHKTKALWQYLQTLPRRMGRSDGRFEPLRQLKGQYQGKRCFITCTGPSLTIQDLEALKNEYVFGMNSICLIHKQTKWKPDFFGIQDKNVFDKVKEALLSTDNGICFAPYSFKKRYNTPDNWIYFHTSGSYHLYEMGYETRFFAKFSDDCYNTVYDGYSITYSIMQLAVYMGFDELYLIGADCSYLGEKQHFIEHGNSNPAFEAGATKRLYASYGEAKKYAEAHGIKIVNVTRGGCLELFPRETLEDVLLRNEKNKTTK